MKINVIHTEEYEVTRVKYTFSKLDFYKEQNYKVFFPEGIVISSSESELVTAIRAEFNSNKITEQIKEIKSLIDINLSNITYYLNSLNTDFPDVIDLVVTQYGVGGSYNLPNRIIVNINYKIDQLFNLIHELTHLAVEENIVQKNNLTHPEKEVLVNWLMERDEGIRSLFPDGFIPSKNKYDADAVLVASKCGLNYYGTVA